MNMGKLRSFKYISGVVYNLVDEPEDDSDYGSGYDSSAEDAEDIFEKITKY